MRRAKKLQLASREAFGVAGRLTIFNARTGEVLVDKDNLVVTAGKNVLRNALYSGATATLTDISVGTGSTIPGVTDTALVAEVFKKALTSRSTPAETKIVVDMYLASSEANGNTLTEAGLWAGATFFARVTHTGIAKNAGLELTYRWEITIN